MGNNIQIAHNFGKLKRLQILKIRKKSEFCGKDLEIVKILAPLTNNYYGKILDKIVRQGGVRKNPT